LPDPSTATKETRPFLAIVHGHCPDGFTAAWAIYKALGTNVDFIHADYGPGGLPEEAVDRHIIMADFAYHRPEMVALGRRNKSLLVLDHHKTAHEALRDLEVDVPGVHVTFDMNRSGAAIAWDHYHGNRRPWLVDYVQDRDLWRWDLPESRAISSYIMMQPYTFEAWDRLNAMDLAEVVPLGRVALEARNHYVEALKGASRRVHLGGPFFSYGEVPVVNAPYYAISDLLSALCEENSLALGWFQRADGNFQFSLRSKGSADVSKIAEFYGGGGHVNAAGFEVTDPRKVFGTQLFNP
jgi:hypothetical protein